MLSFLYDSGLQGGELVKRLLGLGKSFCLCRDFMYISCTPRRVEFILSGYDFLYAISCAFVIERSAWKVLKEYFLLIANFFELRRGHSMTK